MTDLGKRHYIICIHGLGADSSIFCHFEESFKNLSSKKNPNENYEVIFYDYKTGSKNADPLEFSQDLQTLIERLNLIKGDSFSLLMHSQGGVIGTLWLKRAIEIKSTLITHIDSFIFLSTPFWGSKIAVLVNDFQKIWKRTKQQFFLPASEKELKGMRYLSDQTVMLRNFFADKANKLEHIRFLSIGGYTRFMGNFNFIMSDPGFVEGDTAVPLTSSRPNFYHVRSYLEVYEKDHITSLLETKKVDLMDFRVVNALHHSPIPNNKNMPGVAQIPNHCIENEYSEHPSFRHIWQHLLHIEIPEQEKDLVKNLASFELDLNVSLADDELNERDLEVKFTLLNDRAIPIKDLWIGSLIGRAPDHTYKSENQLRYAYYGRLNTGKEYNLKLHIEAKGYISRSIETKIVPGHSTFVDINLIKP